MSLREELTFLSELDNLAGEMLLQAKIIEDAATSWLKAHQEAQPDHARADRDRARLVVLEYIEQQDRFWIALAGFLSAWSRASLLLWPAPRGNPEERKRARLRGTYLSKILKLDESHPLANRDLRNDWMHMDERLDAALSQHRGVTPQRFVEEKYANPGVVLRLIEVRPLAMTIAGQRRYELRPLFKAVHDLKARIANAEESSSERRGDELLADD